MLSVVEPMNVGPAGDLFAIIYIAQENKLYALNASGKAPSRADAGAHERPRLLLESANWGPGSGMPGGGILTVTVPGSVWGWDEVLRRFGTMTFKETLQPAIDYAEQGFPVSERIAHDWRLPRALTAVPGNPRGCCTQVDPDSVATWYINGRPPAPGRSTATPAWPRPSASCSSRAATASTRARWPGRSSPSRRARRTMTLDDLADYSGEWVSPARTNYHGYDVFTLPPPAQTWATGEMLNILEACVPDVGARPDTGDPRARQSAVLALRRRGQEAGLQRSLRVQRRPHVLAGAARTAAVEAVRAVTLRRASTRIGPPPRRPAATSTAAATRSCCPTADRGGNMVAWVNSLYSCFRLGPDRARLRHRRCTTAAALFTLDPKSPNVIAPHKRPFNTLSAGFVMRNDQPLMTVTLMGGDMQAQGIAQVLLNVLDLGANLQAATDMARFRHNQVPNVLTLESQLFALVGGPLRRWVTTCESVNGGIVGGYQAIMFTPDPTTGEATGSGSTRGHYRAGSDHRKDGQAVGF